MNLIKTGCKKADAFTSCCFSHLLRAKVNQFFELEIPTRYLNLFQHDDLQCQLQTAMDHHIVQMVPVSFDSRTIQLLSPADNY
jgi:hypothetical protein